MEEMTAEERRQFLLGGGRTAKLATVREDGSPHVAPVWFTLDADDLLFTTWHTTVKAANLTRDPRVSLCVDDETPPYAFVIIDGRASIDQNAPDLLDWTTRIARRYMGEDLADAFGRRNAVEGEWLIRVEPHKMIARKGIAD